MSALARKYFEVCAYTEDGKRDVFYRSTAKGGAECYLRLINGRKSAGRDVEMLEVTTSMPKQVGVLRPFVFATVGG